MKRNFFFLVLLAGLACASGFLMSKASWIGRVAMTFFYREYNLLKVWWQGAIAVYLIFMGLFLLHTFIYRASHIIAARIWFVLLLLMGVAGAYLTYDDFTNNFSHHLLKWRFHFGFYLIWAGWLLISLFFLSKGKRVKAPKKNEPVQNRPQEIQVQEI
jgi:hypothetical protein